MNALVLLSGGLDSLVTLATAHRTRNVVGLFINIHARASRNELRYARKQARHYGIPLRVIDFELPKMGNHRMMHPDAISTGGLKGYTPGAFKTHVIPYRNVYMLSLAFAQAVVEDASEVWAGLDFNAQGGSSNDKSPDFAKSFQAMIDEASEAYQDVQLITPLIKMRKRTIYTRGKKYNAPFEISYSCYNGMSEACGICPRCRDRSLSFPKFLGMDDPAPRVTRKALLRKVGSERYQNLVETDRIYLP